MREPYTVESDTDHQGLEGLPLVLLHGFAGAPTSWSAVIEHLPGRRTAALALPGHAPNLPVAESFEGNLELMARRVQQVGAPVHLVGYSLGARVALGLLASRPSLVASATLASAHSGLASSDERRERLLWENRWVHLLRDGGIEAFVDAWEQLPLFSTQRRLPPELTHEQRIVRRGHDAEGLARALEGMGLAQMPNFGPALAETPVPVQLVVGELDTKFIAIAQRVTSQNPGVRLHVLPQCGHNPLLEAPSALADLLIEWLATDCIG